MKCNVSGHGRSDTHGLSLVVDSDGGSLLDPRRFRRRAVQLRLLLRSRRATDVSVDPMVFIDAGYLVCTYRPATVGVEIPQGTMESDIASEGPPHWFKQKNPRRTPSSVGSPKCLTYTHIWWNGSGDPVLYNTARRIVEGWLIPRMYHALHTYTYNRSTHRMIGLISMSGGFDPHLHS